MTPQQPQQLTVPATQKAEVEYLPFGSQDSIKLSVNIIRNLIAVPSKSGQLPDDRECMKFLMLCRSRRLDPFQADAFLLGYDGRDGTTWSLITAHQAFLKRGEHHPEYDGMESGVIVKDANDAVIDRKGDFTFEDDVLLGGWATVHFKQRKVPMHRRVRLQTYRKPYGRWNDDAAGMICKVAEADCLRSSFPTLLGGLYTADELPTIDRTSVKLAEVTDLAPAAAAAPAKPKANVIDLPPAPAAQAPAAQEAQRHPAPHDTSSKPKPAPAQEPSAPAPAAAAEPQTATEQAQAEFNERLELTKTINVVMEANDIPIQDVLRFLETNKIAKKGQKMIDLSTPKLRVLSERIQDTATIAEIKKLAEPK